MSEEVFIDDSNYTEPENNNPRENMKGFAITSFVISLVNMLCCFCSLSFILAPISLIFGIVSIVQKRGAKGLAIAGVTISSISIAILIGMNIAFKDVGNDIEKFAANAQNYVAAWENTHEVPQEFVKYKDPKYDKVWARMGMKDFDEFYGQFIESYKQQQGIQTESTGSNSPGGNSSELTFIPFRTVRVSG